MHIAAIANLLAATSPKPTTSSSAGSFIFLIVVFGLLFVMYRMFMRPRQRAAQQQRDTLLTLEPGDEVLTGAGIFGTIQHVQGDRVTLWTGTGSTITVLKRTVVRKIEENDPDYDAGAEHEDGEHDSWDDDDTAALEAHNADGKTDGKTDADEDETGPRLGSTTNGAAAGAAAAGAAALSGDDDTPAATDTPAKEKKNSASSADVANDGHLADRIDELTAPEQPSEDKDR